VRTREKTRARGWGTLALALVSLLCIAQAAPTPPPGSFLRDLAIVDTALKTNPSGVSAEAIESCRTMRDMAVMLYKAGRAERGHRRLKMCKKLLEIEYQQ